LFHQRDSIRSILVSRLFSARQTVDPMPHSFLRLFLLPAFALAVCLTVIQAQVRAPKPSDKKPAAAPRFESQVQAIFKAKCSRCHNPQARKGELDLTTYRGVIKGGESGKVLNLKQPTKSSLYEKLHAGEMPPDGKNKVTQAELETIRRWIAGGAKSSGAAAGVTLNQQDILPIVYLRCTVCHGLRRQEAGLDLRSKVGMLKGGKSGPAIVPGHPEQSLLLKRIRAGQMPPKKKLVDFGVRPVEPAELAKLTKWIKQGAPTAVVKPDVATTKPDPLVSDADRKFWAFQPPRRPAVPLVRNRKRVRNPIDAFLLRKLEAKGLSFSKPADRYTLIRRVAFDLTGLPPAWDDVRKFIADKSPRAYERMVDRYLASPRYGERWGQYWLDVAGYADSEGKRSADVVRPHAWKYRDYVIRSFNSDKPYDRFLREQLAGDELEPWVARPESSKGVATNQHSSHQAHALPKASGRATQVYDNLVATGFLRMAPDGTGSDIVNTVVERMEVVSDELNVLGAGVMGLTIKCAQCHTHKYDPIPQRDYYRLVAVFQGAFDLHDWLRSTVVNNQSKALKGFRTLPFATPEEREEWQAATAKMQKEIDDLRAELKRLKKTLPATKYRRRATQVNRKIRNLKATMPANPGIRALWDRGTPSPTYLFRRGEPTNPGRLVGPGVPSVLTDGKTPFDVKPPWPGAHSTGRRLAFAKWLTRPDHPLTARVMVNRIWYHHFGRGIVSTLGNFGKTGARPSHPELLDWLATEFVKPEVGGQRSEVESRRAGSVSDRSSSRRNPRAWSIKHIHRLILTSTAYRQRSAVTETLEQQDPDNALLSRMPLRRLEAEAVRDSLLAVAGELDLTPFGKPDPVDVRKDGLVTAERGPHGWRRSIYVLHRRKEMPTILENFDLPQMIPNCLQRPKSTVASQALHLMNNATIRALAARFAKRIAREAGPSPGEQIERLYELALSRPPSPAEQRLALSSLQKLTAAWSAELKRRGTADETEATRRALANVCHTLLNSAGFLYVD
jgi:mono/diheme cytochrome c family protein